MRCSLALQTLAVYLDGVLNWAARWPGAAPSRAPCVTSWKVTLTTVCVGFGGWSLCCRLGANLEVCNGHEDDHLWTPHLAIAGT